MKIAAFWYLTLSSLVLNYLPDYKIASQKTKVLKFVLKSHMYYNFLKDLIYIFQYNSVRSQWGYYVNRPATRQMARNEATKQCCSVVFQITPEGVNRLHISLIY
jgi:hypothetical protein